MNKEFVPYEEALDLKELGFDEECLTSYHYDGTLMDIWSVMGFVTNSSLKDPKNFNAYSNSKLLKDYLDNPFTAAPTFSQAINFLYICSNKQIDIELKASDTYEERLRKIDQGCEDLRNLQNSKSN